MGFDPGYVNGCKIAVVDRNGKFLDQSIVYPHKPQAKMESAKKKVVDLVKKYDIDVIAIGNGTASRESEKMIADLILSLIHILLYTALWFVVLQQREMDWILLFKMLLRGQL